MGFDAMIRLVGGIGSILTSTCLGMGIQYASSDQTILYTEPDRR